MTVLLFSMLVLRPDGVLCWVLERVVAPCGFGYVLAACMPVGIGSVPLLLLQQDAGEPIPLPDPALLSCTSMYLLVFIQRVQPGLLVFLWEFEEWQVWWLSHFLKGRMVWEPEQSSQPSACDGSPGDWVSSDLLLFLPWGMPALVWAIFPAVPQQFPSFERSYWVVVIILLQLPRARALKPAASASDVKKGFCAQGTSFPVIACGLRSSILPPCKSCFACYLDRNPIGPLSLHISLLW